MTPIFEHFQGVRHKSGSIDDNLILRTYLSQFGAIIVTTEQRLNRDLISILIS